MTSFLINTVHSILNISYGNSFVLVNFALLFFVGIVLYVLSREWKYTHKEALFSVFLFFLSFSILFSFFSSIYSYDEPFQYLCIFLALIFWYRKQYILFLIFFTAAVICRETTLFLVPALFLFPLDKDPYSRKFSPWKWKRIFIFIIPTLAYVLFKKFFLSHHFFVENLADYTSKRLDHFFFNFQNVQYGVESIVLFFLVLLPSLLLIIAYKKELLKNKFERKLVQAFVLTFIINTMLVFFTARAREARLFALPIVFLWPIFGKYFVQLIEDCKRLYKTKKLSSKRIFQIVILFILSLYIGFRYEPTAAGNFEVGYHIYAAIAFFSFFLVFLIKSLKQEK
jgi:hypothetical protein